MTLTPPLGALFSYDLTMTTPRYKSRPSINIIERILRHLPGDLSDNDCWFTSYAPCLDGYVRIRNLQGPTQLLHRVTWEAHNAEPVPDGMVIMHSCDNRAC